MTDHSNPAPTPGTPLTVETPFEEQRARALDHYERVSNIAGEWSSFVRDAIRERRERVDPDLRLRANIRDVVYGLRHQPEICRDDLADALERAATEAPREPTAARQEAYRAFITRVEAEAAQRALDDAGEKMRQVHAQHDLGHMIGAWPRACALCQAHRALQDRGADREDVSNE